MIGLDATKPVFRVSDKPVSSASKTSKKIEISPAASVDMIRTKTRITKALIGLRGCPVLSAPLMIVNPDDKFSRVAANLE